MSLILIWTVFSGEQCSPWASYYCYMSFCLLYLSIWFSSGPICGQFIERPFYPSFKNIINSLKMCSLVNVHLHTMQMLAFKPEMFCLQFLQIHNLRYPHFFYIGGNIYRYARWKEKYHHFNKFNCPILS